MTVIVAGTLDFDPADSDACIRTSRPHIEGAYTLEGCLEYAFSLDPFNPGRAYVFMRWETEESLAAFFASPWYTAMRDHLGKWGLKGAWLDKYRADLIEPLYHPETGKAKPHFFEG